MEILSFDSKASRNAANIDKYLKKQRNQIDMADLFIAPIAVSNKIPLATLNQKHFKRVKSLIVITPELV